MTETQPLNESEQNRECLKRLGSDAGPLHFAVQALDLVAHSGIGLGEVLQDYARQTSGQLRELMTAATHACADEGGARDAEALRGAHYTLKAVKSVLEMTPSAMERNKAEMLGEKEKLTRAGIAQILNDFLNSQDIARLLASEESGEALAALVRQEAA